jgi:GT2 family glycosyltransferase/glycosyltransferase involved in cell wall biosynthesis
VSTRLHITHSWGGGVGRWVGDFCKGDAGRRSLLLRSCTDRDHAAYRLELLEASDPASPLATWHLRTPIRTTDIASGEYRAILHGVIADHDVRDLVVSSLIGHALDALDTGLPTVVVLHDLYPFCPALFACFGSPCATCEAGRLQRCLQSNPYNCFWHSSKAQDWLQLREAYADRISRQSIALAAPAACVHDRWATLLPALRTLPWHRIAHGLDLGYFERIPPPPPRARLRIVIPGRLAPHKGLHLLREALPELQRMADVLLLGCGDFGKVFESASGVRIVPQYEIEQLAAEIGRFGPDCALLLSVLPESFSYTLSEMHALGVPVLATRLGAFIERIEEGRTGLLFEPQLDALLSCVRRAANERALLAAIASHLAERPRRGLAEMVRAYDDVLAALPAAASPPNPSRTAGIAEGDAPLPEPVPTDSEQAQARNEVRGTFYLPTAARIVFATLPSGSATAAARLVKVARACTAARNDIYVYLLEAADDGAAWGAHRADAALMQATRRLFFAGGHLSRERLLAGADAFLSLVENETAAEDESAALRAGQMLLTFNTAPPSRRARAGGQAAVLTDFDPGASAEALGYWLDQPSEERARVVARTRHELDHGGVAAVSAVVAVVVTHQPARDKLSALLAALSPQVDRLLLVDDGSHPSLEAWLQAHAGPGVEPIFLRENRGLAAAQNAGIAKAHALGADFVLLSDQDSLPEPGMVDALLGAVQTLREQGVRVGAVGPSYREADGSSGPFVRLRGWRYQHLACHGAGGILEVDHLIASGCLIPLPVLQEVGAMAEELFIDYVDVEWGLRARRAGYRSFGVCDAGMRHERGQAPQRIFGRPIPLYAPLRHYYQNRNAVWLICRDWLPLHWKLANAVRLARNLAVYALLPGPRLARWRMAVEGIVHGLRGKLGRRAADGQ